HASCGGSPWHSRTRTMEPPPGVPPAKKGPRTPTPQTAMIAALTSAFLSHGAGAAELKVVSGNGAKAAVTALMAQFERSSGHKIALHFEVNAALKRKIEAGEAFDVAVLNPPVVE